MAQHQQNKYGDLEKYLGKKYAEELSKSRELQSAYEESQDILYGSMDVLSMFNKVNLAMRQLRKNPGDLRAAHE